MDNLSDLLFGNILLINLKYSVLAEHMKSKKKTSLHLGLASNVKKPLLPFQSKLHFIGSQTLQIGIKPIGIKPNAAKPIGIKSIASYKKIALVRHLKTTFILTSSGEMFCRLTLVYELDQGAGGHLGGGGRVDVVPDGV